MPNLGFHETYNAQSVVLTVVSALPGDFNGDGAVNAADYVVWRKTGINGQQGYNDWRTHSGQTAGSGSGASANAAVLEPATLFLLTLATAVGCLRRGRAE